MSVQLPPPFQNTSDGSPSLPPASFLTSNQKTETSDFSNTSQFPPWYSGSETNSTVQQHLSQNRAIQVGVPPTWKCAEGGNTDAFSQWPKPEFPKAEWNPGCSSNYRKFGSFSSGAHKSFFCDSCNRGFGNQEELDEHRASHVKCPFEKCNFKAHPKIVLLHQKLQHSTGLAEKMVCLDTPEGIRKWREERKRNFPTAAHIERKKKEEAEKLARGEELQDKYFGKMKQGKGGRGRGIGTEPLQNVARGRGRGRRRHRHRGRSQPPDSMDLNKQPVLNSSTTAIPNVEECEEEEVKEFKEEVLKRKRPSKSTLAAHTMGGSLSLLAGYGSGSNSDQDDDSNDCSSRKQSCLPPKPIPDMYPIGRKWQPGRRPATLLEKLLSSEIRHERNVILQCVHYTVKKNFFDVQN